MYRPDRRLVRLVQFGILVYYVLTLAVCIGSSVDRYADRLLLGDTLDLTPYRTIWDCFRPSNATRRRHVFLSTVCWAKIGWFSSFTHFYSIDMGIICTASVLLFSYGRSPAIVMAYLMKCKGWRFAQSFQWVRDCRPTVELSQGFSSSP
ncbi:hypothetical protein BHE74_00021389 [Ensete ventricosum]|nr:hypothetical protein BHE74_00021389 [Ensete ventricosum]